MKFKSQDEEHLPKRTGEKTNTYENRQGVKPVTGAGFEQTTSRVPTTITPPRTKVYPKVPGLAAWSENCKW
jgi:hypothetical protein